MCKRARENLASRLGELDIKMKGTTPFGQAALEGEEPASDGVGLDWMPKKLFA